MSDEAGPASGPAASPIVGPAAVPTVGIIANPLAGKDVRRLTSGATPVSDAVKIGAIRRAAVGAIEGGAQRVLVSGDRARLGERALEGLAVARQADVLGPHGWNTGRDSQLTAAQFREAGIGAVIALGGDGTQRDVATGWRDVRLVPLAVGTNNVFPLQVEATLAGFAAGAVASGHAEAAEVTSRAKIIDITIIDGQVMAGQVVGGQSGGSGHAGVALVDVCQVRGVFVGARAVWDAASVSEIVAAIAEPDSVGLSAIAAAVAPTGRGEPGGVHVRLGCPSRNAFDTQTANDDDDGRGGADDGRHGDRSARRVRAAVMPGSYAEIDIAHCDRLRFGQPVTLSGPGVLTLDGEREIVLGPCERAEVTVNPDGPHVIDVGAAVAAAQRRRYPFDPVVAGR